MVKPADILESCLGTLLFADLELFTLTYSIAYFFSLRKLKRPSVCVYTYHPDLLCCFSCISSTQPYFN